MEPLPALAPLPEFIGTPGLPGSGGRAASGIQKKSAGFLDGFFDGFSGAVLSTVPGLGGSQGGSESDEAAPEISIWDKISAFFLRATVIILGFIFVAVGLSMFRSQTPLILNQVSKGAKSLGKKVAGVK